MKPRRPKSQSGSAQGRAFRNLIGVDINHVDRLNLLKLAPGGVDTFETPSELKKGYVLPRPKTINADLCRIINSDEVQSVVRPINKDVRRKVLQKNPLKNLDAMLKLNPYAKTAKRMAC
ncbi:60S ribosomal protein L4-1 [Platanthera guangdongensis]|uniref:60S ribosomal protein L4-1 n=1 Tax=Platanthera guangdongensis TaxID=2320717 RepID=A0ABR2M529_9ASPA